MQSIKVFKHFPFVFPIPLCNLPPQVASSPCHATCRKGNENVVYIHTQSILFSNKKWNFQENEQIWRAFCLLIELVQTQKNRNTCSLSVEDSNNFRIHLGVSVCLFEHMDVHWKSERVIRSTGSGISVVLRTLVLLPKQQSLLTVHPSLQPSFLTFKVDLFGNKGTWR